jgi:anti-sigma factor RsiW
MREYTDAELMAYADRESDETLTRALNKDLVNRPELRARLHVYTWTRQRLLDVGKAL